MSGSDIETEVRSFITPKQYRELLGFFKNKGKFLGREKQTTYYFSGPKDLRIQKTNNSAKLWLKGGKIHDRYRQDIVVRCQGRDFEKLKELLGKLGYRPQIKWLRDRSSFLWQGINVSVDSTRGYGRILELEKICTPGNKRKNYELLLAKMKGLGVKLTSKEEFDRKFAYYKNNWRKLI